MSQHDGVLRKHYEVHCRKCEVPVLGLGGTVTEAADELRRSYGWRVINRRWHCPECANEIASETARADYGSLP